jgi:hypothetical protein
MFDEILVVDYISSYVDLTDEQKANLADQVINNQFLVNCPNGSIIGSPIGQGQIAQSRVYYPFFSHLRVPVKPGERAWACTPNPAGVSYWMTRKVQNMTAEDPNFTHDDRAFTSSIVSATKNSSTFIDAQRSGRSLSDVRDNAISKSQFVGRPALLAKGKSPDLIVQGSNSTSIKLTNDSDGSGAIQLIAGFAPDRDQRVSNILTNVTNNGSYYEFIKPTPTGIEDNAQNPNASSFEIAENPGTITSRSNVIFLTGRNYVEINAGSSTVIVNSNGEVVVTPGSVVKLAGDESNQAYLRYDQFKDIINTLIDMIAALQSTLDTITLSEAALATALPAVAAPAGAVTTVNETANVAIEAYTQSINSLLNTIKSSKILGS